MEIICSSTNPVLIKMEIQEYLELSPDYADKLFEYYQTLSTSDLQLLRELDLNDFRLVNNALRNHDIIPEIKHLLEIMAGAPPYPEDDPNYVDFYSEEEPPPDDSIINKFLMLETSPEIPLIKPNVRCNWKISLSDPDTFIFLVIVTNPIKSDYLTETAIRLRWIMAPCQVNMSFPLQPMPVEVDEDDGTFYIGNLPSYHVLTSFNHEMASFEETLGTSGTLE